MNSLVAGAGSAKYRHMHRHRHTQTQELNTSEARNKFNGSRREERGGGSGCLHSASAL